MTQLRGEREQQEPGLVRSPLRDSPVAGRGGPPLVLCSSGSRLIWRHVPWGVVLNGAELGLLSALIAVGLALTFRANRIINFAQADLGIVPSLLAVAPHPRQGLELLVRDAARAASRPRCSARSSS